MFILTWGIDPIWLIFFRLVETTNYFSTYDTLVISSLSWRLLCSTHAVRWLHLPASIFSTGLAVARTGSDKWQPLGNLPNMSEISSEIHEKFIPVSQSMVLMFFCFKSFSKDSRFPTQMTLINSFQHIKWKPPEIPNKKWGKNLPEIPRRSLMPYWKSSMKRWKSLGSATPNNSTLHLGFWVTPAKVSIPLVVVIWDPWKGGKSNLIQIYGHFSRDFP